jgi:SAM-dependent methyltransferase
MEMAGDSSQRSAGATSACPCCHGEALAPVYHAASVPVQDTTLFRDPTAARAITRGRLDIRLCRSCGFIFNAAFDPSLPLYSAEYEETQGFSPTFQAFHRRLADELTARFGLSGKRIVEIGCGKGEFLALLCAGGRNCGLGIDPAFRPDRHPDPENPRLEFRADWFRDGDSLADFDLVCCKMTLEHIHSAADFLGAIANGLGARPARLFFQVPEMERILREGAFWDIYYEHCSYFTAGSLRSLFEHGGFEVDRVWTGYDDQYLMIAARWDGQPKPAPARDPRTGARITPAVERFRASVARLRAAWQTHLETLRRRGESLVIWGGSSKTVAFLSFIGETPVIPAAVDINPHKQGTFLPASGLPIVAPEALVGLQPDEVLIMNPVYTGEIRAELDRLGLHPRLSAINRG